MLPRTYDPATGTYGNLYGNLLDYVISAALIFYILTIAGMFRLRATRPDADGRTGRSAIRSCRRCTSLGAATILMVLFVYRPATTWPGLLIVLLGCRCTSRGTGGRKGRNAKCTMRRCDDATMRRWKD